MSHGIEWAIHCVIVLAQLPNGGPLPRRSLAEHYALPEAYLAKHLKALVRAGLLSATTGPGGGFQLARPPAEITVLDVVDAIEGDDSPFCCTEIRQRGIAATPPELCRAPCAVSAVFTGAYGAWRTSLQSRTIADLAAGLPVEVKRAVHQRYVDDR